MPLFNEKYKTSLKDMSITNKVDYLDLEEYFKKVSVSHAIPKNRVVLEGEEHIKREPLSKMVGELLKSDAIHLEKYTGYDPVFGENENYRLSIDILDTKAMRKKYTSSEFI